MKQEEVEEYLHMIAKGLGHCEEGAFEDDVGWKCIFRKTHYSGKMCPIKEWIAKNCSCQLSISETIFMLWERPW